MDPEDIVAGLDPKRLLRAVFAGKFAGIGESLRGTVDNGVLKAGMIGSRGRSIKELGGTQAIVNRGKRRIVGGGIGMGGLGGGGAYMYHRSAARNGLRSHSSGGTGANY